MPYSTSAQATTIAGLLGGQDGSLPALRDESGARMSYAELSQQAERTAAALAASGIGRGDPVAMVLENGPHMAAAFVAVAAAAAAAPLHPGLREREFRDSLESLRARALIVTAGSETPATMVARQLSVPILQLEAIDPAGGFRLVGGPAAGGKLPDPARAEDTALLLHTSGTTAKPKLVPLTQGNLAASAANIASTLRLGPEDTCLNIMPLFHIHGLIGALLSSLCAGASVAATPGFAPMRFFKWLDDLRPTWYSAVPTMHQAILQRSARNAASLGRSQLRLIRSSSAALPPSVLAALEEAFGCPVVESYGMTEAAHQMASNPLPPAVRKPGTVGLAAGPEVAIIDGAGSPQPVGATGEVVIRGANVMAGYVDNPQANASAFHGQWFRTGDQGICDSDGYFTITGRLKELINRGGEKISPREIDEALLEHPAVAQAVAFAVPHAKLGEEVAAAVVLEEGSDLTQRALGQFAAERLAAHKVPRVVRFVEAIPKGPSGKLKRVGLAKDLGLD